MREVILDRILVNLIAELLLALDKLCDVFYDNESEIFLALDFVNLLDLKLKVSNQVLLLLVSIHGANAVKLGLLKILVGGLWRLWLLNALVDLKFVFDINVKLRLVLKILNWFTFTLFNLNKLLLHITNVACVSHFWSDYILV